MYNLIESLCKARGTTITRLCIDVTGNSGNLRTWKKGYMRSDYLKRVADILEVSTDYLLGRTNNPNTASLIDVNPELLIFIQDHQELIELIKNIPEDKVSKAEGYMNALCDLNI